MTDDTHRVVGGSVHRPDETLSVGDTCVPTDAELAAFPDRFETLDGAAGDDEDSVSFDQDGARAYLTDEGISPDDYRELQKLAGDVDGVSGNAPKEDMQIQLAEALARQQ